MAATAHLAARAGIRVFATGGLGGVHRGARESWDESADLTTLAQTGIVVVCAGVKSILDVGATLERLETLNVTVLGYGSDSFPGFYLSDSGHPVAWRVDSPAEVAAVAKARTELGTDERAVVVANPLPTDEQLDPALHDRVLAEGFAAAAQRRRVRQGRDAVPARLPRARDRRREPGGERAARDPQRRFGRADRGRARGVSRPLVLGDVMVDVVARLSGPLAPGSDSHAVIRFHGGGSAANTAAWLAQAGTEPLLVGRVGDDERGQTVRDELRAAGVEVALTVDPELPTGTCIVLVGPDGERTMAPDAGANDGLSDATCPTSCSRPPPTCTWLATRCSGPDRGPPPARRSRERSSAG